MTSDMIAMASNWDERLRAPKGEKKDDPQVWATSFPHLITLTKREKNLKPESNDNLQKTNYNWTITY